MAGGIGSMEFLLTQILLLFQQAIDGFQFNPTEQQLINHLKSEKPGCRGGFCIIPTLENITDFNPWQLPAKFTEQSIIPSSDREWWFIVPQMPNQRVRRKTPCGVSWRVTGDPRDIRSDGKMIGFKKILDFPEGKGGKSNWIIHEYHLPENSPNQSGNNVLCRLMGKQDEKADNSTTGSKDGKFTLLEAEEWCNQSNDQPEGISPELHTISWPHLMQMLQRELESPSIRQSTNIGSSYVPDADLSNAEVQNGEEPRFAMVQQENGARNIEDEAAARAKLLQHGVQSPNNSSSSPIHQFTNTGSLSGYDFSLDNSLSDKSIEMKSSHRTTKEDEWIDATPAADLSQTKVQKGEEPRFEMVQQENGTRNIEDEAAARGKLLPHGRQSPNNSSSSTIFQCTNIRSLSDADLSYAKGQKGEEGRFEMFQQETGARNIEDEAAAGAKNGQIFITENRRSKVEPLNCVFPPEETEGFPSSPLRSSGFMDFTEFGDFFHQPADQEKGLEHEEHNLAGNPPKRRRLDVSEENQIQ